MSTYINDSKDTLERHVGKKHKESSLVVSDILEFKGLPLKDECNQSCNKLQKFPKIRRLRSWSKWGLRKISITIVWNALTFKTAGSLLIDRKDLHMTALNCANHDAL